jgi:hypothetical protein
MLDTAMIEGDHPTDPPPIDVDEKGGDVASAGPV